MRAPVSAIEPGDLGRVDPDARAARPAPGRASRRPASPGRPRRARVVAGWPGTVDGSGHDAALAPEPAGLRLLVLLRDLLLLLHLRLGVEILPAEQDDHRERDREKQVAVVFFHHDRKQVSLTPVGARGFRTGRCSVCAACGVCRGWTEPGLAGRARSSATESSATSSWKGAVRVSGRATMTMSQRARRLGARARSRPRRAAGGGCGCASRRCRPCARR